LAVYNVKHESTLLIKKQTHFGSLKYVKFLKETLAL